MRHIRRAAVTGLFAIWLAPLSAMAEAPKGAACCTGQGLQAERLSVEARREQDDDRAGDEATTRA